MKKDSFRIENLQFYWRLKDTPAEKNIVPNFLPFELNYDPKLGLFVQKRNKKVLSSLNKIYKEEWNIGNIQEVNDWGRLYKKDFVNFMESFIVSRFKKIKKILEIGCGACVLLEKLKKQGYQVLGIDPSILSKKEGERKNVEVIVDFYPSKKIKGKFDLIYHSDVLEHIADPVRFLQLNFDQLNNGGMLILTVPDCTDSILNGDISILYHQHMNYFDKDSLRRTLEITGFSQIQVEKAKFGGSLNCVALKSNQHSRKQELIKDETKFQTFLKKNSRLVKRFKDDIRKIINDKNATLGFYAPIRILPYLAILNLYKGYRFFDDTSRWHLKYLDGNNIPMENFNDLKRNPVTNLIIMSPTFGKIIEQKVKKYFSNKIKVKKLTDFYNQI